MFKNLLLAILITPLLSACAFHINLGDDEYSSSWSSNSNDERVKIETNIQGKISFNEAETDIVDFPANSGLVLETIQNGQVIKLEAKSDNSSRLQMVYHVDGESVSRSELPNELLQQAWQVFFRVTGINAAERVERIVRLQGMNMLIQEISQINSNSVSRRYIQEAVNNYDLNTNHMQDLIRQAESLNSNQSKKQALLSIFEGMRALHEPEMLALLDAAKSVSSSSNLRDFLKELLDSNRVYQYDDIVYLEILNTAKVISSSSNMRSFIISFIDHVDTPMLNTHTLYSEAIEVAGNTIGSSSNLREAYLFVLEKSLTPDNLEVLIQKASQSIGSSSNLEEVLSACIRHEAFSSELAQSMRTAIDKVGSSSSRENLRSQLLDVLI